MRRGRLSLGYELPGQIFSGGAYEKMLPAAVRGRVSFSRIEIKSMPAAVDQEALHVHRQLHHMSTTAGKT